MICWEQCSCSKGSPQKTLIYFPLLPIKFSLHFYLQHCQELSCSWGTGTFFLVLSLLAGEPPFFHPSWRVRHRPHGNTPGARLASPWVQRALWEGSSTNKSIGARQAKNWNPTPALQQGWDSALPHFYPHCTWSNFITHKVFYWWWNTQFSLPSLFFSFFFFFWGCKCWETELLPAWHLPLGIPAFCSACGFLWMSGCEVETTQDSSEEQDSVPYIYRSSSAKCSS